MRKGKGASDGVPYAAFVQVGHTTGTHVNEAGFRSPRAATHTKALDVAKTSGIVRVMRPTIVLCREHARHRAPASVVEAGIGGAGRALPWHQLGRVIIVRRAPQH